MFANNIFITERSFGRVEAHLENVANAYAVHLVPHIPKLCELFVGTRESGKKYVQKPTFVWTISVT